MLVLKCSSTLYSLLSKTGNNEMSIKKRMNITVVYHYNQIQYENFFKKFKKHTTESLSNMNVSQT